jgi:hypothetical protein
MRVRPLFLACAAAILPAFAQDPPPPNDKEVEEASEQYMRDELGVNTITTPSIGKILNDLGKFHPIPIAVIETNDLEAVYDNRLQTAMHFGSLVADGFMLTIAERPQGVQAVGKALIRASRALGVGDRVAKRSKSLLEFSDKSDWVGMREELIRTQGDVESSMLDLRDEELAHLVSLGGWLRGFQLAAHSCAENYSADRAAILARTEIMDYYLDRLDTLHPRLRKTELVTALIAKLRSIRAIAEDVAGKPTEGEVGKMRLLADEAIVVALSPVDAEGRPIKVPASL